KEGRRWMSQAMAKDGGQEIVSTFCWSGPTPPTSAVACTSCSKALRTSGKYIWPSGVRARPRGLRSKRRRPSRSSRWRIWWLIAEGVRLSSSAAAAKLMCRAAASKARSAWSGGRLAAMAPSPRATPAGSGRGVDRCRLDLVADVALELREIVLEALGHLARRLVIGGLVGPGLARVEHVARDALAALRNEEAEIVLASHRRLA